LFQKGFIALGDLYTTHTIILHADFINLNSEIRLFDWEGFLLSSENIDEMSIKFTNKFIEFVKMYIPIKIITIYSITCAIMKIGGKNIRIFYFSYGAETIV
jgi:hypothetical protein